MKRLFTIMFAIVLALQIVSHGGASAEMPKIKLTINGKVFTATMNDNAAAKAFIELMPTTINMSDYGGFEKVGSLGASLPRTDETITTQPGDLILYQGNSLVLFYGSNTWSYTRLGRIDDITGLAAALGSGSMQITFETIVEKIEGVPLIVEKIEKVNRRLAKVTVYNPNDDNVTGVLLTAIYESGKLVEVKMLDKTFAGKQSITVDVDFSSEIKKNYTIKAFVWKSIGSMQPLSNAL